MAKKASYNPIHTGVDPRSMGNANGDGPQYGFVKLDNGESLDVVCLVDVEDIIATEQCAIWLKNSGEALPDGRKIISPVWVYTGPEDPMHELNEVKKNYRAYLPVLVDGEPKVWPMGKMAHSQILDISDASGNTAGMVLRLKRTGTGLGTRYSVLPTGKRKDISTVKEVDVISILGPLTPDGVRKLIAERLCLDSYEDVLDKYRGKAVVSGDVAAPAKKSKAKKAVVIEEPDDEDDEDLLLDDDDDDDE